METQTSNDVLGLAEACVVVHKDHLPVGAKKPSIATPHRWARRGVRAADGERVYLQIAKIGGRWTTRRAWLAAFFDELSERERAARETPPTPKPRPRPRSTAAREQAIAAAEASLD